jgi:AraC family transcriptional regulator
MFQSVLPELAPVATLRPIRATDYSVLVQASGPACLPARYGSFHVIGIPLSPGYAVERGTHTLTRCLRLRFGDVSIHAAGPGDHVYWAEGARCLYIHLHPRTVREAAELLLGTSDVSISSHDRLRDSELHDIGLAFAELVATHREPGDSITRELIVALTKRLVARYSVPITPRPTIGRCDVDDILDRIRMEGRELGSMSELARECGLTRAHFSRRFRVVTGSTPYASMHLSQVERAKYLLVIGRSITEAALEAGFVDQSHLSRVFRQFLGITPRQFLRWDLEIRRKLLSLED